MEYRKIGNSELRVSNISLGSWLTYGGGVDSDAATACVNKAFDVGINFIDTANIYARGEAETFLGKVLDGRDRASYVLATKLFFPMTSTDKGLSAAQIKKQIEDSLRRLRTDHVDLYQAHRYDPDTPLSETMQAFTDVVREGKVRYIGFSEWRPQQIRAAIEMTGVEPFVSSQPQYSMLWRRPEKEVIPLCREHGIGQIVWSPLAQGVLTGKYRPAEPPPADSRGADEYMGTMMDDWRAEPVLRAVQGLTAIADGLGVTMAQLALAWVLREPGVSSAIIGASRPSQVEENAAASDLRLDESTLAAIDVALADVL